MLSEEARAARAAYARKWRKRNPDKVKRYEANKWEKAAGKIPTPRIEKDVKSELPDTEKTGKIKAPKSPAPRATDPAWKAIPKYLHEFNAFWDAYPKKRGKGNAVKAWNNVVTGKEVIYEIMEALESARKCKDWSRDKGQFIPYPATWLNGRRWQDDYSDAESDGSKVEDIGSGRYDLIDDESDW